MAIAAHAVCIDTSLPAAMLAEHLAGRLVSGGS
jgi:hypothetical protein